MTQFNIDVVSDTVCPWCYVGKRKLDKAIEEYKRKYPESKDTFTTTWKPYFLNPAAPKIGAPKAEIYAQKFGPERAQQIFARLSSVGEENGIKFNFAGNSGHTGSSHRLIQFAGTKFPELQNRVVDELFKGYFENEQDITDLDFLKGAGVRAGLDEKEVDEWLKSGKGTKEVEEEVLKAKMAGINGVPNFVVDGRFEVGGAQDSAVFVQLFERIKAQEAAKANSPTRSGDAL